MPVLTNKVTKEQREWLERYEHETTFEPFRQEELNGCPAKFYEVARANIDWFENWAGDVLLRISKQTPGFFEAFDADTEPAQREGS